MSKITAELSTDLRPRLNMVMETKERFLTAQSPQDPTTALAPPPLSPRPHQASRGAVPGIHPNTEQERKGPEAGVCRGLGSSLRPTLRSDQLPGITTRRKSKHRSRPCASEYPVMGPPSITSLSGRIILTKTRCQSRKRTT